MLLAALITSVCAASDLDVSIDMDGLFNITYAGELMLSGGEVRVAGLSSSSKTLVLAGAPVSGSGTDRVGQYKTTTFTWQAVQHNSAETKSDSKELLRTTIRTYDAEDFVLFEQYFPTTINSNFQSPSDNMDKCRIITEAKFHLTKSVSGYDAYTPSGSSFSKHAHNYCDDGKYAYTSNDLDQAGCAAKCKALSCTCFDFTEHKPPAPHSSGSAQTLFPGFFRSPTADLDCFAYHGVFPGLRPCTVGTYKESHQVTSI